MPFRLYAPGTRKGNQHWLAIINVDGRQHERSLGTTKKREAQRVAALIEAELSAPANPARRPRGRPSVTPGETKRHSVVLYVTRAMKQELDEASKRSGRSLTAEVEARLQRTLDEDRDKSDNELFIDLVKLEMGKLLAEFVAKYPVPALGPADLAAWYSQKPASWFPEKPAVPEPKQGLAFPVGVDELAAWLGGITRRTLLRRMSEAGIRGTGRGRTRSLTEEEYRRLIEWLEERTPPLKPRAYPARPPAEKARVA
jgi:hypothetical protein